MSQRAVPAWMAIVCTALLQSAAWAANCPAQVAGSGEASVQVVPTKLRIQIPVVTHGKTAESAIQRLKARREAVTDNLCALGADRQSLNFGDPTVSSIARPTPAAPPSGYYSPMPQPTPAPPRYIPGPATYVPSGSAPGLPPAVLTPPTTVPLAEPPSSTTPQPATPAPTLTPSSVPSRATPRTTFAPSTADRVPDVPPTVPSEGPPALQPTPADSGPAGEPTGGPATARPARSHGQPTDLYAATQTLTIDWGLNVKTVEEAVVAGEALRKKLLAADNLLGGKAAEKLPADEQELLDELGPMQNSQTIRRPVWEVGPDGVQRVREVDEQVFAAPGAVSTGNAYLPPLLYVAAITSQQRKALLSEAFGKARSQAAELAEASGGKLGPVSNLSGDVTNSRLAPRYFEVSPPTCLPGLPGILSPNENRNEATAREPFGLKFYAKVHARFTLE